MLTDVFVHRYQNVVLTEDYGPNIKALMTQSYRIIFEQLFPFWVDGKISDWANKSLQQVSDKVAMELGLLELSQKYFSYQGTWNGSPHTYTGTYTLDNICKLYICMAYDGSVAPSQFLAARLSFVELAFRLRGDQVAKANAELPQRMRDLIEGPLKTFTTGRRPLIPGYTQEAIIAGNNNLNVQYKVNVDELNARFRQAGLKLQYRNGFIQGSDDELVGKQIEKPFWKLCADPRFANVDLDMKEALDRRDTGARDAAFHALKALESTIKIISSEKNFTTGGEKGASNYIDNLVSQKNGRFIDVWEGESLKALFAKIRNPMGHGAGADQPIELDAPQTSWAIETAMSWIKSLASRL